MLCDPSRFPETKFSLLQEGDTIQAGDQWYDPVNDAWCDTEEEFIGDPFDTEVFKPMRRSNPYNESR